MKNSRKRLNSLILLVAFTAIMLIVSTYAWFSAQREVQISGLTGTVEAAEGLQISLDAATWTNSLSLADNAIVDAYDNDTNLMPTELLPVSTTGTGNAIGATEIPMYRGVNEDVKLNTIKAVDTSIDDSSDNQYPGYIAFDLFVKNTGDSTTAENLLLGKGSKVAVSKSGVNTVGLENTVRVAFAKFSGVYDGVLANATADQIIAATNAGTSKINQISIWEPNADKHVAKVVSTFGSDTVKKTEGYYNVVDNAVLPTFALLDGAVDQTITDIYDWSGANSTVMAEAKTVQTNATEVGANTELTLTTDPASNLTINANEVTKLRVYVWLEGQDVDCINWASQGGGIAVDFGLAK